MTGNICKCIDELHDHSKECMHNGITGTIEDWICNWCDLIHGNPSPSTIEAHRKFTDMLKKEGRRT